MFTKDPWHEVRGFIDAFNSNMVTAFPPGKFITVDEIMSAWKGLCGIYNADGLPHKTKIQRKPEGQGAELKALACAETNIILRLDLMEGKDANRLKAYVAEFGEGTAVVLRLCSPYAGTGRFVVADSAFSSIKCCIAVYCILGLFFGGMVKTAHMHFPKDFLNNWFRDEDARHKADPVGYLRGSWITLQSTFTNTRNALDLTPHILYAVGWADKKMKMLVCNFGTSIQCPDDCERRRKQKVTDPLTGLYETIDFVKRIKRPDFVKKIFDAFPPIDINDHYRQGILELERSWLTVRWWIRIFTTLLGVIVVNCYFAFRCEQRRRQLFRGEESIDFINFIGKLAYELIFNPFVPQNVADNIRRRHEDNDDDDNYDVSDFYQIKVLRSSVSVYLVLFYLSGSRGP